ncbi:MAG: hypothetical protein QM791_12395 [Ferruginibacter sp.]
MIKAFALSAAVVISCAIFLYTLKPIVRDNNSYLAASIDKEKRLDTLSSPRIIFTGGSNLCFGLDAEKISNTFQLPVVDMSLHAGLGLFFILNETKAGIREGDVIILSTEYFLAGTDKKLAVQLVDVNPAAATYFKANGKQNFLKETKAFLELSINDCQRCNSGLFYKAFPFFLTETNGSVYHRDQFDANGSMTGHLKLPQPTLVLNRKMEIISYHSQLEELNSFIDYAKEKGATVYYAYPNYPQTAYTINQAAIESFSQKMNNSLHCEIINTPQTFLYPDKYFFDLTYHLNKTGRELRTGTMIDLLKRKIRQLTAMP